MTFEDLLKNPVRIHRGRSVTYGVSSQVAMMLHDAAPGAVTLETGSGLSTLVLLQGGVRKHIAIQPYPDEFSAIVEFCTANDIPVDPLEAIVAYSQEYLPSATLPALDVVLIDGAHMFPIPFLDWFYCAKALKVGGLLIIDDTHIVTGTILANFLERESAWRLVARDTEGKRFVAFSRVADDRPPIDDWQGQPYLADFYPTASIKIRRQPPKSDIERVAARVLPWRLQVRLRERFGWPRPRWIA